LDLGFDVVLHGKSKVGIDATINGLQAQFKELSEATTNAVYQNIREGTRMSPYAIIDGRGAGLDVATGQAGLAEAMRKTIPNRPDLQGIIILTKDGPITYTK
jgi:hypothetical protein